MQCFSDKKCLRKENCSHLSNNKSENLFCFPISIHKLDSLFFARKVYNHYPISTHPSKLIFIVRLQCWLYIALGIQTNSLSTIVNYKYQVEYDN